MKFISPLSEVARKWKCIENDNSGNIAPQCHHCLHILCLPAVSKHFFILFPHPWKPSLWNSTGAAHESTPTQPPSLLRALESNFLLIKFTIKAPLMPTSATLPFCFVFFSSIPLYIILISSWALWNTVYWHNENSLWVYCSFGTETSMGAPLREGLVFLISTSGQQTCFFFFFNTTSVIVLLDHDHNMLWWSEEVIRPWSKSNSL